jgi:hypothetical protein
MIGLDSLISMKPLSLEDRLIVYYYAGFVPNTLLRKKIITVEFLDFVLLVNKFGFDDYLVDIN